MVSTLQLKDIDWQIGFKTEARPLHIDKGNNPSGGQVVNIYTQDIGAPNFIKQTLLDTKAQLDPNTIVVGDINTPLSSIDRSSRPKKNEDTSELNNTTDQVDLRDMERICHPTGVQYTCFSAAHGSFSKMHHISGHT
jgi:hypothetical protein